MLSWNCYPSRAAEFTSILVALMSLDRLFSVFLLSFFFLPLYFRLSFSDLQFLIKSFVSSSFSRSNHGKHYPIVDTINWLTDWFLVFNATFSNISAIPWRRFCSGRSRSTSREQPTMGKQLVNFITCRCESSTPFFVIYKAGSELTLHWWYACMSC